MRGQITIFIILGIIALMLGGSVFVLVGKVQAEENTQQIKEAIKVDTEQLSLILEEGVDTFKEIFPISMKHFHYRICQWKPMMTMQS